MKCYRNISHSLEVPDSMALLYEQMTNFALCFTYLPHSNPPVTLGDSSVYLVRGLRPECGPLSPSLIFFISFPLCLFVINKSTFLGTS